MVLHTVVFLLNILVAASFLFFIIKVFLDNVDSKKKYKYLICMINTRYTVIKIVLSFIFIYALLHTILLVNTFVLSNSLNFSLLGSSIRVKEINYSIITIIGVSIFTFILIEFLYISCGIIFMFIYLILTDYLKLKLDFTNEAGKQSNSQG